MTKRYGIAIVLLFILAAGLVVLHQRGPSVPVLVAKNGSSTSPSSAGSRDLTAARTPASGAEKSVQRGAGREALPWEAAGEPDLVWNTNPSGTTDTELLALLAQDSICEVVRLLNNDDSKIATAFAASLLAKVSGASSEDRASVAALVTARAMTEKSAKAALSILASYRHEITDFYRAAILGDFLYQHPSEAPDHEAALALLDELEKTYPDNGIYPFEKATLLYKRGSTAHELRPIYMRVFTRPRFENFFTNPRLALARAGFASPGYFALAAILGGTLPSIDLVAGNNGIVAYLRGQDDPAFASAALAWGRMVVREVESHRHQKEGFYWTALTHAVGYVTARNAWTKLNAKAAFPPDLQKSYKELIEAPLEQRWSGAFKDLVGESAGECKREGFDKVFQEKAGLR